jgi:hypothetical protein
MLVSSYNDLIYNLINQTFMTRNLITVSLLIILSSCNKYQIGHVILGMPSTKIKTITFDNEPTDHQLFIQYPNSKTDPYLKELRETYHLESLTNKAKSDTEKALILLDWTHKQWSHNGNNQPSKADALTILEEAKVGSLFRCVEYGIVSTDALLSLDLKARLVALKSRDVETCKTGAGHVLAEVWLPEHNKWALIDGQYNIMPMLNNVPLNAVEFQQAIVNKKPFLLINSKGEISKKERKQYLQFIPHYLYFFDIPFDNRRNSSQQDRHTYKGKDLLMLVPKGAKQPTIFQKRFDIGNVHYTSSIADFYKPPY